MAPVYAGALQPKKKQELQDIANALKLSDAGTKDDLQSRIKKHLESKPELEDDPRFAGLYPNKGRRRSVQPQPAPPVQPLIPSSRLAPLASETIKTNSSPSRESRRISALDPVVEATPEAERRDASMFLKNPMAAEEEEEEDSTEQSPRQISNVAPNTSLLAPPSPEKAPEQSLVQQIPEQISARIGALSARIKNAEVTQKATQNSVETIEHLRHFLSNSQNLWSLTVLGELLYVLNQVIPWKVNELPIANVGETAVTLPLYYPPLSTFQTSSFWLVLFHWALPTLVLPAVLGHLISFSPRAARSPASGPSATPRQLSPAPPQAPLDSLTVAIVRLAAQIGYPYAKVDQSLHGVDVIGHQWRVLNASVCLAFAFAEAILGQPQAFVRTITAERRYNRLIEGSPAPESPSIRRMAIMHRESGSHEQEVD